MKKYLYIILVGFFLFIPVFSFAQSTNNTANNVVKVLGGTPTNSNNTTQVFTVPTPAPKDASAQSTIDILKGGTASTQAAPTTGSSSGANTSTSSSTAGTAGSAPTVSLNLIKANYDTSNAACVNLSQAADTSISSQLKCNSTIKKIWTYIIGLVDTVVVVALLAIAFATILHINYDTYGVKKALPAIIIGLVMAHFSLLICRYIVDFAQVLEATFYNSAGHLVSCPNAGNAADGIACGLSHTIFTQGIASINSTFIKGGAFFPTLILSLFIIWIPTVIILILALELYIRFYLLFFLTIIAPAAWLAISWGPIQGMFKKWWGEFTKWTFMGPLVMFYLWMSIMFYAKSNATEATFGTYLLSLMMLYLAVMAPKALGGAVGGFISNKVLGGVNKGGSAALKSYTGGVKNGWNAIGNITPRGEFAKRWGYDGATSLRAKSKGGWIGSTPGDLWKGYRKEKTDNDELRQLQVDSELAKKFGGGIINDVMSKQSLFKDKQAKAKAAKELYNLRHDVNYAAEKEKRRPNPYQGMSPAGLKSHQARIMASEDVDDIRQYAMAVAGSRHPVEGDPLVELMLSKKLKSGASPFDENFIYKLDNEKAKVGASGIYDPTIRDEAVEKHFGSEEAVRKGGANRTAQDLVHTYSEDDLRNYQTELAKIQNKPADERNDFETKNLTNVTKLLRRIEIATKNGNKMIKLDKGMMSGLGIETKPGDAGNHVNETIEALKKNTKAMDKLHRFAGTPVTKDLSNLMKRDQFIDESIR